MLAPSTASLVGDVGLYALDGEDLARESAARLLITAGHASAVEVIARRIHASSLRARFPFVHVSAAALPTEPDRLRVAWSGLLAAAVGGSLLVRDVEIMPALVQEQFTELLDQCDDARAPAAAVRLVSGTTVMLFDRIASGSFSERLFYRLNTLHLVAGPGRSTVPSE
jgi:DNA-binding NtrC family response regulator